MPKELARRVPFKKFKRGLPVKKGLWVTSVDAKTKDLEDYFAVVVDPECGANVRTFIL